MRTLLLTQQLLLSNLQTSRQLFSIHPRAWLRLEQVVFAMFSLRKVSQTKNMLKTEENHVYRATYYLLYSLTNLRHETIKNQEVDIQDHLKKTLEEDEERHGKHARDRDTGEELEDDQTVNEKDKEKEAEGKKDKKKDEDDDNDDEGGGGLLMPVIEWIGGLIARPVKEPK